MDVAKDGTYRIQLYRWPPNLQHSYSKDLPLGDKVDGGKAFAKGLGFNPQKMTINIQGQSIEKMVTGNDVFGEFELELKTGKANLSTRILDDQGVERGAYYVLINTL